MKGAAIDLGSNSFICYVFENKGGKLSTLEDQIVLVRLSEGVDQTKKLSPLALQRSENAFQSFENLFIKHGVTEIRAVATSAARDAENQKEFLGLAAKYKIPVQIISGEEEANLTFKGVEENFATQDGLIIDIGGGSTEFVLVQNGQLQDRVSLNVGVVRFSERYLSSNDFKSQEPVLRKAIQKELHDNPKLKSFKNNNIEVFLAVSGTPTAATAILQNHFDPEKINGAMLNQEGLLLVIQNYGYLNMDQRLEKYPYIESKRADVLPTGVLILDEALNYFDFKSGYKISTQGIRHGLARSMCGFDSGI